MKRIVAITLAVLMLTALFAGCGSSGPEGKYVVKSVDGQAVNEAFDAAAKAANTSADEYLKMLGIDNPEELATIELKSDGSATMSSKAFSYSGDGTWTQDGNKISITIEGDTSVFTLNGNELSNDTGDPKYVLIKK